jgi:putative endonuclease
MKNSGKFGEDLAVKFLTDKSYRILERNWRGVKGLRSPEIDIIAEKDGYLIFIEVKTASTKKFGLPEQWITPRKQKRLIEGARTYILSRDIDNPGCRFDIIAIERRHQPPVIRHIKNAFMTSEVEDDQ